MEHSLRGHWGNRNSDDSVYQIGFDFVAQLEEIMKSEDIGRAELAAKLGVTKGRVSQILNNPGNLTLKIIAQYTRVLSRKVTIVTYDDQDLGHESGPIHPQVFVTCWKKAGRPTDFFSAGAIAAAATETEIAARWSWSPEAGIADTELDEEAETLGSSESDNWAQYRPSLEELDYAGTDTARL
jgi:transcriptional regulator with XRE-family HTH domain